MTIGHTHGATVTAEQVDRNRRQFRGYCTAARLLRDADRREVATVVDARQLGLALADAAKREAA